MARARNPKRDEALRLYMDSSGVLKLKDIGKELDIPDSRIRKWKVEDKWDEKIKERSFSGNRSAPIERERKPKTGAPYGNKNAAGHGAPKGNKNAVGNHGGAPKKNTNAVTTGEHQTIWLDVMDADEQAMFASISTDPLVQIDEDIRLLTYRERRMLTYLNDLKAKKDLSEQKDVYEMQMRPVITEVYDEATGTVRKTKIHQRQKVLVEQTQTTKMLIDKILRIEEALTRIQEKKIRAIESKHRILLNPTSADKGMATPVQIVDDIDGDGEI
jgi:uncharacterized protein YjcR